MEDSEDDSTVSDDGIPVIQPTRPSPVYVVTNHVRRSERGSLVDRGANGGLVGKDAHVLLQHQRSVDVTGIDNHEMNALRIVDAAAKILTQRGYAIAILRQYAYHGLGRTIHSCTQLEHYKNHVDDRSLHAGGTQCIRTHDGYVIPLDIINGLPYMKMVPYTTHEWETLPHVILTSGAEWDTTVLDHTLSDQTDWYNTVKALNDREMDTPFDEYGNYRHRQATPTISDAADAIVPHVPDGLPPGQSHVPIPSEEVTPYMAEEPTFEGNVTETFRELYLAAMDYNQLVIYETEQPEPLTAPADPPLEVTGETQTRPKPINYEKYRPYFLHVPVEKVRRTFQNTTQFASNVMSGRIVQHTIKPPYPAYNVRRRNEPVATDTVYGATPAIGTGGAKAAQIFIGRKSLVIDIFGMKSTAEFVNTLEDVIRKRGAMDKLTSDSATVEISARVKDILRALIIDSWQSEATYQHQNFAEHRWNHFKRNIQWIMNWRNVPPNIWLLCAKWVADIMNHTAEKSLGWRPPLQVLTGQTVDISIILCFMFWDVVYVPRYKTDKYNNQIGHEKSSEIRGRFVGFSWEVGHALTFKILTDDTQKIICRSQVRLGTEGENNLRLDAEANALPERMFIQSKRDADGENVKLPTIDISTNPFTVQDHVSDKDKPAESLDTTNPVEAPIRPKPGELLHTSSNENGEQPAVTTDKGEHKTPTSGNTTNKGEHKTPTVETVYDEEDSDDESWTPDSDDDAESLFHDYDTVESDDEEYTPMDDPPLSKRPTVDTVEDDDEDEELAPHLREHKDDGDPIISNRPLNLDLEDMATERPVEPNRLPPEEMKGRTFLLPPRDDGTRYRAKIIDMVNAHKDKAQEHAMQNPEYIKFRCLVNNQYEDIVSYNDICDHIEMDQTDEGIWTYQEILDHAVMDKEDTRYPMWKNFYRKGSIALLILWDTGERSWEPLVNSKKTGMFNCDPVPVTQYAVDHGLVGKPGWDKANMRMYAKNLKVLSRRLRQAKLHSFRTRPVYMYGYLVPRNYDQAVQIDKDNGNTKWQDAIALELNQIDEYETFEDKGRGYNPGPDYKKIRCHLVFAVKHDGRHKARLVAGGHLTDTPIDSICSSVVSLKGIRLLTFIGELNKLGIWATDIGNAYLESRTKEKVYIVAGPEFGDRQGHTLIIVKALYGLKSSGLRWAERFADVLREMGFFPSRAERDIWMRDKGDHWEYVAVYVDDLLIVSKNPKDITDTLERDHKFKLKGSGPISFHLGCDFMRDDDDVLCYAPKKYIEKLLDTYERMFGSKPRQVSSPLEKGDHPELDSSELLNEDDIKKYQSMIGALQWVIQIGRFDITTAVMTMSRFRASPRQGHLDRVKRMYGYLSKMRHGIIRIRTLQPDYSDIPVKMYDWEYTCYAGSKEEIPSNIPRPLGKEVVSTSFVDANLYHDLISGKSVTGILHLLNQTPVDWYSKLQGTVETATFGSEFVAARTATEQIIELRITLRYLGVPVKGSAFMFGDNETVVNSASIPHSRLHKRHNALSYHRVREAIAAKVLRFTHVRGNLNPADILSKHWAYPAIWPVLKPLLFWQGDTAQLMKPLEPSEKAIPIEYPSPAVNK
jgi:hypothetical protein